MFKKAFFVALLALFLAACGDKGISGKYEGIWDPDKGYKYTIKIQGDHYKVILNIPGFDRSTLATEDKHGNLVIADNERNAGQVLFTYKDKNTLYRGGDEDEVYHRVTDQK